MLSSYVDPVFNSPEASTIILAVCPCGFPHFG